MRNVVAGLFISVDGVVESPNQWQFDVFNDEFMAALMEDFDQQDATLLGRVTYQEWNSYWPNSKDEPFASLINNRPKYVVSTTLDRVEWGAFDTVKLFEGGLVDGINQLKHQDGKAIGVGGSPTLVHSLLKHHLLDELKLYVHPVVVGNGKRLFKEGDDLKRLKLHQHKITSTGVAILSYAIVK